MNTNEEVLLTQEGYELKKKKLEEYRRILHEELPKKLKLAKDHGAELRENKEYLDLKSQQDFYEAEVRRLEELLERAKVIDADQISTKEVGIGTRVTLKDKVSGEMAMFKLVGPAEVDLEQGRISTTSPLGKALMGHRKGEEVVVETPKGIIRYKILGIERGGR